VTRITEIAPDIFRISIFIPEANLQFAQFLARRAFAFSHPKPTINDISETANGGKPHLH
jgi:hypothetical protein